MRDIIDERNEKERISRSIVKFWNVNYVPVIEKTEDVQPEQNFDETAMNDEELMDMAEKLYNKATKSYSGVYGSEVIEDEVTKGQIDKILQEKDDVLRKLLEQKTKDFSAGES